MSFYLQGSGEKLVAKIMHSNASENGIAFVNILIISVTLIVVAVPEGMPLESRRLSICAKHA